MSNDRELLEMAAKAAGYAINWGDWQDFGSHVRHRNVTIGEYWNPYHDDAQLLRLATNLRLDISHNDDGDSLYVKAHRKGVEMCSAPVQSIEEFEREPQRLAATRRAIVRAASEIGRST